MGGLSWISGWALKRNHKCPYKGWVEGYLTQKKEGQVTTSAEREREGEREKLIWRCNTVGFEEGERGHEPRHVALEAGKGKKTDCPLS